MTTIRSLADEFHMQPYEAAAYLDLGRDYDETAWDADHAEQLIELQVERSGECLDCGQSPCVVQAIHGVPCRELVR